MKIQILSDVHLEFEPKVLPKISSEADVIVCAGDISPSGEQVRVFFEGIRNQTDAPIVYVLGNHEFYGKFLHQVSVFRDALSCVRNCHILDRDSWSFEGVRFIGCTLWTDFDDRRGELSAQHGMADFNHIRKVDQHYGIGFISTADILREYYKCRNYLDQAFQNFKHSSSEDTAVVVTHHGPSFYCVPEKYRGNPLNGAFFVELSNLIVRENPAVWIHGHSHDFKRVQIGSTDVVCNPWGYPQEANTGYVEELLVEVGNGKEEKRGKKDSS